jgi:hypothetical protein
VLRTRIEGSYEVPRQLVPGGKSEDPIDRWVVGGLGAGSLHGDAISVTARLNKLRLVSVEGDGCVSAMAYVEAKRTTGLDPVTTRALDRQHAWKIVVPLTCMSMKALDASKPV